MNEAEHVRAMPADYYRRHAERVRRLASEATTAAAKEHLQDVAMQYDRLAEQPEMPTLFKDR